MTLYAWLFIAPAISFIFMTILFCIAQWLKDNSIADIGWSILIMLLACVSLTATSLITVKKYLITVLVLIWGIRLSWHIFLRHHGEDPRYKKFRATWNPRYFLIKSYVLIFLLQGALAVIIASPILVINLDEHIRQLSLFDAAAYILWLIGYCFEALGDYQLKQFLQKRTDPTTIMQSGLWRYTRHPNYFGELCMWWAFFIAALPVPYGFLTIVSPLTLTILLMYVSGIPLVEEQFKDNLAYQHYKQKTNALIPWFAKE